MKLINSGELSSAQLETVAYCSQIHEQYLSTTNTSNNNEFLYHNYQNNYQKKEKNTKNNQNNDKNPAVRKGFFLGDGAGVGKGRQLAGIIYENWQAGRHRHLWISVSSDLHLDARRDLDDIGANHIDCYKQLTFRRHAIEQEDGVIFSTYNGLISSLRAGNNKKRSRRLDLLVNWCGGADFHGCILFDECHKAKNLIPSKGGMKPTQMGLAVKEIQELLPNARIVYCSATGCSEPGDMAYMLRLGLWGPSTAFPYGFDSFRKAFDQGGVGMM